MKNNSRHVKVFTRRAFLVAGAQGALLGVLGTRLAWLQVAQGSRYKTLAEQNRINMKILAPSRGQIVDRYGVPLAVNEQNFRVLIVPEQTANLEASLRKLQTIIQIDESEIQDVLKDAKRVAKFVPIEVKDDLSWDDISSIEVNIPDLPGIETDVGERRGYPLGEATAHLIGYVGAVNKEEIEGDDPVLSQPGFKIGKTGIEKRYDLELRGEKGHAEVEVNVIGREVRELKAQDSIAGQRITLTIDGELQRVTQERLALERSASAVIMDAHSGAVYALASYPSFDPNVFTSGISATQMLELNSDVAHPFVNKAISGQYPPASTFKMVTALAGMEAGNVTPSRTSYCKGYIEFGKQRFHCWKHGGHGRVDLQDALAYSCDVYFYELASEIGIDKIAETARMMGLGNKLDFDLPEERPGLVPDKNWKLGFNGTKWQPGETIVASIGQGYLLATPLQLAVMTARLANGGYAVKPWITEGGLSPNSASKGQWPKMPIDPDHLKQINDGMNKVVNSPRGTAFGSRITEEAMAMAGKTGTGQVQRITMQQREAGVKNEDLQWKSRHHALFVGYAPLENPRYVCSVVVEHGVGGSKAAAPIAKELLIEVQKRDPANSSVTKEVNA